MSSDTSTRKPVPFIESRGQLEELIGTDAPAVELIDEWETVDRMIRTDERSDARRFLLSRWSYVVAQIIRLHILKSTAGEGRDNASQTQT